LARLARGRRWPGPLTPRSRLAPRLAALPPSPSPSLRSDGKIAEAKFKTFGCGSAIASSSVATEWVKGRSIEEVLTIKNTDIAAHLKLPPVKLHCSMLAEDAIKAAVADYATKQGIQVPKAGGAGAAAASASSA